MTRLNGTELWNAMKLTKEIGTGKALQRSVGSLCRKNDSWMRASIAYCREGHWSVVSGGDRLRVTYFDSAYEAVSFVMRNKYCFYSGNGNVNCVLYTLYGGENK